MKRAPTIRAGGVSLVVLLALSTASHAVSEQEIRAHLKKDFVKVGDGKYVVDRLRLCRLVLPEARGGHESEPFQIKLHVEAAQDVISRDNFIGLLTELAVHLRMSFVSGLVRGLQPEEALAALRCEDIKEPVGSGIDFSVQIGMSQEGVRIGISDAATGKQDRELYPWAAVFGQ
ncbi:MAG: hypothetical protein ACE5LB_01315 [Acidiferrobacterales bacterium]